MTLIAIAKLLISCQDFIVYNVVKAFVEKSIVKIKMLCVARNLAHVPKTRHGVLFYY